MNNIHGISLYFDQQIICISNSEQIMEILSQNLKSKRIKFPLGDKKNLLFVCAIDL